MSEPGDPKPEYQLSDSDFELIKQVEFRLNNIITVLMGHLQIAIESGELDWPDEKLQALQNFFWERCTAIDKNKVHFEESLNSDMRKFAVLFPIMSEQLMSLTGAISMYLRDRDIQQFYNMVVDIYSRMEPSVNSFAGNRAYGAYKNRIRTGNLEVTRNHFEYEDRRSGQ